MKPKTIQTKYLSFQRKLTLSIIIITLIITTFVSLLFYTWHANQTNTNSIDQRQQLIDQLGINIDTYFDELYRLTLTPYYNDEVMNDLKDANISTLNFTERQEIEQFLSSAMVLPRDEILRDYIFTDHTYFSFTRTPHDMAGLKNYLSSDWYQKAKRSSHPILLQVHSEKAYWKKETQIISVMRSLHDKNNPEDVVGVIRVDADYSTIKSLCDNVRFEDRGALYLLTPDSKIIYSKNSLSTKNISGAFKDPLKHGHKKIVLDGKSYMLNIETLKNSGLKIVALTSYETLINETLTNLLKTLFYTGVLLIFSLICINAFMTKYFAPLNRVINTMDQVKLGNMNITVPIERNDEIGHLADSFNLMLKNLKAEMQENDELNQKIYNTRYLYKISQYNELCSQIKPHFLYNTLNNICLLIKTDECDKAVKMTENLSKFLRGVINVNNEIPLQTELALIQSYMDIQSIRYEDRLDYSISVDDSITSILIPALSIQPIIENTIKHCLEEVNRPIHVQIDIEKNENILIIFVSDNGPGMTPEFLSSVNKKLNSSGKKDGIWKSEGIGLLNIHNRLQLLYGEKSGLSISSKTNVGTTVKLTLCLSDRLLNTIEENI
ncbi:MAG: sensor histidine kinase [Lachnospiraceae bacterium]|nr:sensor histidine kinase [Lachnospiraceae bacterium]